MDELKNKEVQNQNLQVQSEKEYQVISMSLEDFLGDDYKQLEESENQVEKDIQAGNELVEQVSHKNDWEVIEMDHVATLDEQFENARRLAHQHEKNVSKIKKSTLKKRRAEYARKTEEHTAMLTAQQQLKEFREGETKRKLENEFVRASNRQGQSLQHTSDRITHQAMDAVMYFQKKEGFVVDDMSIMFRDLCFDTEKTDSKTMKGMKEEDRKRATEQFGSKMALYEKLFAEALSWDPKEFAIKDNHALSQDPKFMKKMEKLTLIPVLKSSLEEYHKLMENGRMNELRANNKKAFLPEKLMDELKVRLDYYEAVQGEMEARMDLMSSKYYALLGKSDTADMDVSKLGRLGDFDTVRLKDPEMTRYFNAVYRLRLSNNTGGELKGKNPTSVLDRMRKTKNIKTGKSADAATAEGIEEFTLANHVVAKNAIKSRRDKAFASGEIAVDKFDFMDSTTVDFQIEAVHRQLEIDLKDEDKAAIRSSFKERLKDSQHARELIDKNNERRAALEAELNARLFKEIPGSFGGSVREEREGILEYLLSPEFQNEEAKEKQYEIYRSVMLPYLKKDADLTEDEKLESKKTILQVFRDTLKNDDQLDILSKYKTPQEFAAKASQEEFNRLMQLRHIGGWVNHIIFEKKDETILKLMNMEDFNEYRDLYVRLAKAAYGFGNAVSSEVDLVGNINYAFMSEASIEKLGADEMRLKSFYSNSLDYLKNRQQMVSSEKDNYRIGENAAKRMEADAKVFEGKIELYESFTKYHKEGLYRKSNYSDVQGGMIELSEFSGMTDKELVEKREETEQKLQKDMEALKAAKELVTTDYLIKVKAVNQEYIGNHTKSGQGKDVPVDEKLRGMENKIRSLYDSFRKNGSSFEEAPAKLLEDFREAGAELDRLMNMGDIFLLPAIWQAKVWDMVSMVRPVLVFAEEMDEYKEAQDEEYVKPVYDEIKEDFDDELSALKDDTLEEAKEKDPVLKAYLEEAEYDKAVGKHRRDMSRLDGELAKRKERNNGRLESEELNRLLYEKLNELKVKEPLVSKHLQNRKFVHTYEECRDLLEKYRTDLWNIDELDSDILTKERIAEIGEDFEFFKSLIEDEKSGTIFAVQENLAENFWNAYYILAPVAAYAKSMDGEPSMDEILRLKKDKSLTVNRAEAETRYQARQLRNKQDQLDYDYMKTYLELIDLRDIKTAVDNQ